MNETLYQLKETFLKEWPLRRIQNMTLGEYTNLDKTSFCYWVEATTTDLGSIWGGYEVEDSELGMVAEIL